MSNAHLFMPKYIDVIEIKDHATEVSTSSFVGRIARHGEGKARNWTMHVVEKLWFAEHSNESIQDDTARITYSFAWDPQAVTDAKRTIRTKPQDAEDVYDKDHIFKDDLMYYPGLYSVIGEMALVGRDECSDLIKNLRIFDDTSAKIMHYNR